MASCVDRLGAERAARVAGGNDQARPGRELPGHGWIEPDLDESIGSRGPRLLIPWVKLQLHGPPAGIQGPADGTDGEQHIDGGVQRPKLGIGLGRLPKPPEAIASRSSDSIRRAMESTASRRISTATIRLP